MATDEVKADKRLQAFHKVVVNEREP